MDVLDATCVVNCDMEIESYDFGFYNRAGTLTICGNVTIKVSKTAEGCYAVYLRNGAFIVAESATMDISNSFYVVAEASCSVLGKITSAGLTNHGTFTISGEVIASGSIYNYGTFTISGEITIAYTSDSTFNNTNYGIYNSGNFVISGKGAIVITAPSLGWGITSYIYGIYNTNVFIVTEGVMLDITITGTGVNNYGIYNTGEFNVDGSVVIIAPNGINNTNTLNGTGTITVNDEPYDF